MVYVFFFFFFQAEDGIRDYKVTGVQTCALPICDVMTMCHESLLYYIQRGSEYILFLLLLLGMSQTSPHWMANMGGSPFTLKSKQFNSLPSQLFDELPRMVI